MKPILTVIVFYVFSFQLEAQVSFTLSSSPNVNCPHSVAAADVNGDGKVDLIAANSDGPLGVGNTLSVLTNDGSGGFVLASSPRVGNNPNSVVAADVNGDGKVDLITANFDDSTLSVLTNDGTGGFLTAGTYAVGSHPPVVVAADVNGDGKVDLISANYWGNTLSVLTNDGGGGFVLAYTLSVPGPLSVTAADVNGDGKVDLICANHSANTLTLLTNNGSGGFVLASTLSVGSGPYWVLAADVNGDGKADLISANWGDNTLSVLTNNGSGGFVLASTLSVGSNPWSVLAADVNGDRKADLICANEGDNTLSVLTNDGSGGFVLAASPGVGSYPNLVAAADVNGDGKVDLICANRVDNTLSVLTNDTPFPYPLSITSFSPQSGIVGTVVNISGVNFDPTPGNNTVHFGAVQASISAASVTNLTVTVPVSATYAPITVTVNGLVAYADQPFMPTFPGSGQIDSASLGSPLVLTGGSGSVLPVIADLDGDGKPDLVVVNVYDDTISLFQNISTNGSLTTNSFAPRVDLPSFGGTPGGLAVADVDGDGKLDLLVSDSSNNRIVVYRNISTIGTLTTNSFAAPVYLGVGASPTTVCVRDLDGDGRPDIVCVNFGDNTLSILRNIGTAGSLTTNSFAPQTVLTTASEPRDLVIADLDGDGSPDLVVINYSDTSRALSIFRNNSTLGNISFDPRADFEGFQSASVAVGDLDGDGKLDIAVSAFQNGQCVSLYRNLSTPGSLTTNSFAPHVDFAVGGWGNTVAIADLDGDGKPDLAVVTQLPDHLSLFKNISTPGSLTTNSFAPRVDYPAGWNPNGIAIGDLDGDGRPEVVFADQYDSTIYIYQNQVPFATPPVITLQPQSVTANAHDSILFSVTASGTIPLSYQWSFNSTNILGATNDSLTISNVTQSTLGAYAVVVANGFGSVPSSNAMLSMHPFLAAPFNGIVAVWGKDAILSVGAWGTGPLSYQWFKDGIAILNATNSTLDLSSIQFTNAGLYWVVVSSPLGSVTNTPEQVVVNPAGVSLGLYPGVTVSGVVGYTYLIQSTSDLSNTNSWVLEATLTLQVPIQLWVDIQANTTLPGSTQKFYRVLPGQ